MSDDREHSRLGFSKAERWTNCPGSVALCDTVPAPPSSAAALRGTALHSVVERCLIGGFDARTFKGTGLAEAPAYNIKEADVEAAQTAIDFCRKYTGPGFEWGVEQGFALPDFDVELFGTNDFWAYRAADATLYVVDHKFGFKKVAAAGNLQTRGYALGAMMALGEKPISTIHSYIVQPGDFESPIKADDPLDAMDLIEYGGWLAEKAEATRQPDAPLRSGTWCHFCPAAPTCPKLLEDAQRVAAEDFADTQEPDAVELMDAKTLGDRLNRADILRAWLSNLEDFARREALAGRVPDGRKLIEGRVVRKFKDGELAMRQAARRFNVPESDLFTSKPVTPAQFEKIAKKVADKAAIQEFVGAYLAPAKPGLKLVSASHKSPAVQPPADADFGDLIDAEEESEE